jgi:phosphatidylserine/phosphatidylglycerophosphate/cardiolipin synthase-like enzyme
MSFELHGLMSSASSPAEADASRDVDGADRIVWLIDNADAYRTLLAACRTARSTIWMTQLAFDADCVAYLPDDAVPVEGEASEMRVADELLAAAGRGVAVRILLNASFLLDTAAALRRHFAAAGADTERLRIRGIDRFPQLLHAKIVLVDGVTAFLIGSPFANGYWDDSHHLPRDERRPERELGGRPLHDLSVELGGPAVAQLIETFAELWNGADDLVDGDDEPLTAPPAPEGGAVAIVRSAPRPRLARQPAARTEILPALLEGLASAERLVYIEHQYLSSIAVIDALTAALEARPALDVIVVVNQNPDVTAYRGWQNRRLAAAGLFAHPRVGIFSPWTLATPEPGAGMVSQIFIHSKVVVVDDRWAMVGSANLDGVSLETYGDDFSGRLGQRVFRGVRNFDVAAVLEGAPGTWAASAIVELRTALWREHLDAPDLDAAAEPPEGWLAAWRAHADRNVDVLRGWAAERGHAGSSELESAILMLPYSRASTPARQLGRLGVAIAKGDCRLGFHPSWIEVHLSPNWLRNIFA